MACIRYSMPRPENAPESGKLLYVTSSVYSSDWKSFLHTHDCSELFYCLRGRGEFRVEKERLPVQSGDILIVNPHVRHTETSTMEFPLHYIALGIDGLSFAFEGATQYGRFHLPENSDQRNELKELLRESEAQQPFFGPVCQNLFELFLFRLLRDAACQVTVMPPKRIPIECVQVKNYIDSHISQPLTLDLLAEQVHLNKFYLAHAFSGAYGTPIINYLLAQKLRCAQDHLADTDLSIAEVAEVSGYSSQSYFSQLFKKSTGLTPAQYRKQMRSVK